MVETHFGTALFNFFFKFDLLGKIGVVTHYNIAQHNIMHLGNKVYNFSLVFSQYFDEYFM